MKRTAALLFTLIVLSCFTTALFSQSLQDNPDYRKSLELKRQSEQAFDDGDYLEAKRLAEESKVYAERSDAWIKMMLNRYKANSALRRVETQIRSADNVNAAENFPEAYQSGKALYEEAYQLFQDEEYLTSYDKSLEALEVMSVIHYIRPDGAKVAAYKVRLLPDNRDCLWNIAGYDFVYGDPWKWKLIYEANKDKLPQPENPRLILPDMILTIPSAEGEARSGTWVNGVIQ